VVAVPYSMPLTSLTGSETQQLDCVGDCLSPMRLLVPDSLAFDDGISMNIGQSSPYFRVVRELTQSCCRTWA
jgi:hypothetical protein